MHNLACGVLGARLAPGQGVTCVSALADPLDAFKGLSGTLDIAGGTAHIPVMKKAARNIMSACPDIRITVAGGRLGRRRQAGGGGPCGHRQHRPSSAFIGMKTPSRLSPVSRFVNL